MGQTGLSGLFKSRSHLVEEIEYRDLAAVVLVDNHFKAVVQKKPIVGKHSGACVLLGCEVKMPQKKESKSCGFFFFALSLPFVEVVRIFTKKTELWFASLS